MCGALKQQIQVESEIGVFYLVGSERAVTGLHFTSRPLSLIPVTEAFAVLRDAAAQLQAYMAGERKSFEIPLEPEGTAFQKSVWAELLKIPYGETRTYKDIALALQNERAVRAVGAANGRNPISILVPCHRVIAANGKMQGYLGGVELKRRLLDLERSSLRT